MTNLVNFELFFTKLSEIDTYEKRIDNPGGHAWGHFFMACHKLGAMAIYLVKRACVYDILASVYEIFKKVTLNIGRVEMINAIVDATTNRQEVIATS